MKISEAKEQIRVAQDELSLTEMAFADVLSCRVEWFGRVPFRVGITRPMGAAGGIAVEYKAGMVRVQYAERYFTRELQNIAALVTGHDTEYNRELVSRRAVIEAAQAYLNRAQSAA